MPEHPVPLDSALFCTTTGDVKLQVRLQDDQVLREGVAVPCGVSAKGSIPEHCGLTGSQCASRASFVVLRLQLEQAETGILA